MAAMVLSSVGAFAQQAAGTTTIQPKVGFSDSTYFYKCFKNKYGIAPSKYGK